MIRAGLRAILSTAPEVEVVGETANGREAVDAIERLAPDVVLMFLKMPGMNGVEATRTQAAVLALRAGLVDEGGTAR